MHRDCQGKSLFCQCNLLFVLLCSSRATCRYCTGQGSCRTASSCSQMQATTKLTSCGSSECVDPFRCQKSAAVATSDAPNEVCFTNADVAACDDVTCAGKLAGWNGATCMQWTRDSTGHCDVDGACVDQCADVPSQSQRSFGACLSASCINPSACVSGTSNSTAFSADDFCLTSNEACPGGECRAGGKCTFTSEACTLDGDCMGAYCADDPSRGGNYCCDDPCTDTCRECIDGSEFRQFIIYNISDYLLFILCTFFSMRTNQQYCCVWHI